MPSQVDFAVAPRGAVQHRTREVGAEALEQLHRVQGASAKVMDTLALLVTLIERLIRAELRLDLLVFRERLSVLSAELSRSFAFCEREILQSVLGH